MVQAHLVANYNPNDFENNLNTTLKQIAQDPTKVYKDIKYQYTGTNSMVYHAALVIYEQL